VPRFRQTDVSQKRFLPTRQGTLYLLSSDEAKAWRVKEIIKAGGIIGVSILIEFVSVASRTLRMPLSESREVLETIRKVMPVQPVTGIKAVVAGRLR
jgi:predicted nucleic acid-binding protein